MIESAGKKSVLVVDVPGTLTADEAEQLLNDACKPGYYPRAIVPGLDGSSRAYFALRVQSDSKESHPRRDADGKESEAISIIRAHVNESASRLERRLASSGIKRSQNWIGKKRLPMRAEGSLRSGEKA
jgi:hypothetical protein